MVAISTIVDQVRNIAVQYPTVRRVLLFGSRARHDFENRSDLDFAIDAPEMSGKDWLALVDEIESIDTLIEMDVVRYDRASDEFKEQLKKDGVVTIYEQS